MNILNIKLNNSDTCCHVPACMRTISNTQTHTHKHTLQPLHYACYLWTDGRTVEGREGGRERGKERERERERGMETPVAVCMHTWTCVVSGCTRAACACTHTHTLTHTPWHLHTHTHQIQYRDALQKLIKIREQETAQADILKSQCPSTCILLLTCILLFIFSRASAFSVFSKHPQKSVPKP